MLTCRLVTATDPAVNVIDIVPTKASVRRRLHKVAGWKVTSPIDRELQQALRERSQEYWVLICDDETGQWFGGPLLEAYRRGAGSQGVIELAGEDMNALINRNVVTPIPSQQSFFSTPRASQYHEITAQASVALRDYVDLHAGFSAESYRRLQVSLTPAALNVGLTVTGKADIETDRLFEFCASLAAEGGVIIDFEMAATSKAYMRVREPRETNLEFSDERGVTVEWEFFERAHPANILFVGGKGEGVDRPIQYIAGPAYAKWGARRELFVDRSSLDASGLAAEGAQLANFELIPEQGMSVKGLRPAGEYVFGVDYVLGDIVRVQADQTVYRQMITQVDLQWSNKGRVEKVTTGEPVIAGVSLGLVADVPFHARPIPAPQAGTIVLTNGPAFELTEGTFNMFVVSANAGDVIKIQVRTPTTGWQPANGTAIQHTFTADAANVTIAGAVDHGFNSGEVEYRYTIEGNGGLDYSLPVPVFITPISVPGQPEDFTASISAGTAVLLDWTRPLADPGYPAASSVDVGYRSPGGVWETTNSAVDPDAQATGIDNSPAPGSTWEYRVRFRNSEGSGPWSASAFVTFADAPTTTSSFTTHDGGRFLTHDGGTFQTGS